jgi:AcrR family transcriptional regulator
MTETSVGRRDRKRAATHQSLRAAALRLGAERGVQHVTVEEIANEADVSVRTFYDHFASKQDAVIGFDEWRIAHLREALRARPAHESPRVALRAVLRELLVESSAEWPLRMRAVAGDPTMLPHMFASFVGYERAIVEVIAERTGLDPTLDLYPTLLTTVASGAFRATMTVWRANAQAVDLLTIFDDAFAHLARGLRWRSPSGGAHEEPTPC